MSIFSMNDDEIHSFVQLNKINKMEKDKYGEVFTSFELINEIINELPKSIWNNPNKKWLDPASGNGHFIAILYVKLLDGLKNEIPQIEKRKKHIIENMLYMVEINPKNVEYLKRFFGKQANICLGDFLDPSQKWKTDLGTSSFDVILGNPPFQTSKTKSYQGSVGNRTLWNKFLESIFQNKIIKPKGFLGFITPANWRRPEHELYSLMTRENYMKYLHIYSKKDGLQKLGAQTRFDLYLIQEGEHKKKTHIIDELGNKHSMNLKKWPFLPNYHYQKIKKILVPKEEGIDVLFHAGIYDARKLSKKKTKKNRHPIVHNITQRGLGLKYAENKNNHFGTSKVLLNFNEKQYPYNDYKGTYGMSQLTFGIPIQSKKQGDKIIKAINSDDFKEILKATKWSSFQTDYRMFFYFDPKYFI